MVSPYLATVHDADIHGNPIENTKRAAQGAYRTPSGSYTWNRSTPKPAVPHTFIEGRVASNGPLDTMVRAFSKKEYPITIFTSQQDWTEEDNEVEGYGFRKLFFSDDTSVVDPEAVSDIQKYVRMTVLISKTDESVENPEIFVEQRVFQNRCRRTIVHQLVFDGRIQCDVDYRFVGCGDEHQPGKSRDLILRVKSLDIQMFRSRMQSAVYFGYDIKRRYLINEANISQGQAVNWGDDTASPIMFLTGEQLRELRDADSKKKVPIQGYGWGNELVHLNLTGMGKSSGDGSHVGDLRIQIVYV